MTRSTKSGNFCKIACSLLCFAAFANVLANDHPNHQVYTLLEQRGTYYLDFDKTYETVASLDVETIVTLPEGYTYSLTRTGTGDFINAFVMQNSLFFTRTIDHKISTSITCNVITPEGETKTLIFKIRGGRDEPVVYAIHFIMPPKEDDGIQSRGEPVKDCTPEIQLATDKLERTILDESHKITMTQAIPAFFNKHRKTMKKEFKGATAYFNGIIFSRDDAYIYLLSNVKKDQCDIIQLLAVKQGKNKLNAELVDIFENIDGTWSYVYKAPLQLPKKRTSLQFIIQIWSKTFTYSARMS